MGNRNEEQVIFIKDLLFAALYQWRKVLVAAVVLALVLGGLMAFSSMRELQSQNAEQPQTEIEEYLTAVQQIEMLQDNILSQQKYMRESILMSLDPYAVGKAVGTVTVTLDAIPEEESTQTTELVKRYGAMLSDGQLLEKTAILMDVDTQYLSELVAFSYSGTDTAQSQILSITVSHSAREAAETILQALLDNLDSIYEKLSGIPHSVDCHTAFSVQVDRGLLKLQAEERQNLKNLKAALVEKEKECAALEEAEAGKLNISDVIKKTVIFAVIGAVLGAAVVACWTWVQHIAGGKVYSARTLNAWTGIRILGCAAVKEYSNPIDRWLRKLEQRAQAEQLSVTGANLRNYCLAEQSVLVCVDGECDQQTLQVLSDTGVQTRVCGSLTNDVAALQALPQCSAVVLVVRCGSSQYRDVARQMAMVNDQQKKLLGCVLLGG